MRYRYSSRNFFGKTCHNSCVFSVYFDCILNEKWFFSNRNNDISCTHARGMLPCEKILKKCAI